MAKWHFFCHICCGCSYTHSFKQLMCPFFFFWRGKHPHNSLNENRVKIQGLHYRRNYWFLLEDHWCGPPGSSQPIGKCHVAIFFDSSPHQPLPITLTQLETQNQKQNTVLLLWYADTTAKKTKGDNKSVEIHLRI